MLLGYEEALWPALWRIEDTSNFVKQLSDFFLSYIITTVRMELALKNVI